MTGLNVATTINPRFDHVTPIEATRSAVTITHRCHVLAELMAVARSGLVDIVLVANDFEMISLETIQQLADSDGYGPKLAAISDVADDRQRLTELGIPVVSAQRSGPELVEWLQDAYAQDRAPADASSELSPAELQFLEQLDPDRKTPTTVGPVDKLSPQPRSGRRAAPYDPSKDVLDDAVATARPLPLDPDSTALAPERYEPVPSHELDQPLDAASLEENIESTGEHLIAKAEASDEQDPLGHVTAVWGPIGSPGVTIIAVNIAVESALAGYRTLLIDADTYGAAVAVHLGLLDDTAAIAQACRAAEHRGIDATALASFTQKVTVQGARLDVITGLTRSERWPQVRAAAWARVLDAARGGWDQVIIDCGFGLEEDEELSFDIPAPQRNATTITAVTTADTVVAAGNGDPVGFVRFMKGLERLRETTGSTIVPVVNKVAAMTSGVSPKHQLVGVWERFGPPVALQHFIAWAPEVTAAALLGGKTLAESAPKTEVRQTIRKLMLACVPAPAPLAQTVSAGKTPSRTPKFSLRDVVVSIKQRVSPTK